MSKIIAVANKKGGAGKSTLTINLAVAAQAAQVSTAIIDIDPDQQAAARWRDSRTAPSPIVLSAVYSRLPQAVLEAEQRGAELILIDTPAFLETIISAAIAVADLVQIPCRTTGQDVQYLPTTIDIVAARRKPAVVVLNSVEPRLSETADAISVIQNMGITIAPYHLSKAVALHRAITAGLGVTELEPTGKAAQEILHLLAWTTRLLYTSNAREVDNSQPTGSAA